MYISDVGVELDVATDFSRLVWNQSRWWLFNDHLTNLQCMLKYSHIIRSPTGEPRIGSCKPVCGTFANCREPVRLMSVAAFFFYSIGYKFVHIRRFRVLRVERFENFCLVYEIDGMRLIYAEIKWGSRGRFCPLHRKVALCWGYPFWWLL